MTARVRPWMVALYIALLVATVAGVALLIVAGDHEHALPAIAGGYDLRAADACWK